MLMIEQEPTRAVKNKLLWSPFEGDLFLCTFFGDVYILDWLSVKYIR